MVGWSSLQQEENEIIRPYKYREKLWISFNNWARQGICYFIPSVLLKLFVKGHGLLLEFKIKNKRALLKRKKIALTCNSAPNKTLTPNVVIVYM